MCDTIVATPAATSAGVMLFGKNSDREPDEAQNLVIIPAQDYSGAERCHCTYLTIPQVSHTYRVFLSQPFWMWGAEMGANEFGVVIGNEALLTKVTPTPLGLTGMDLLRLALERSRTAKAALNIIIGLLETHGQGGKCGYRTGLTYMNGFLIADPQEAYVLETVGKMWAWKQIEGVWAISNKISLHSDFDAASPDLIPFALKKGWASSSDTFDFAKAYSNRIITWGAAGKKRECSNSSFLSNHHGSLTLRDFASLLRHHTGNSSWKPTTGLRMTVCAHATNTITRNSETVNSFLARLDPSADQENFAHYFTTGTSNPCISPYFPIFAPDTTLPQHYYPGSSDFEEDTFWWKTFDIHRRIHKYFIAAQPAISSSIEKFEASLFTKFDQSLDQATIDAKFDSVLDFNDAIAEKIFSLPRTTYSWRYNRYWNKIYRQIHYNPSVSL